MNLTTHFTLEELCYSRTAQKMSIPNTPDITQIQNLKYLAENILEPLRVYAKQPIHINSGFRTPALNNAIGGARNSQHMKGEAADIRIPDITKGKQLFNYIRDNLNYDQLIWEHNKYNNYWIHVSIKRNEQNRKQVISSMLKK